MVITANNTILMEGQDDFARTTLSPQSELENGSSSQQREKGGVVEDQSRSKRVKVTLQ